MIICEFVDECGSELGLMVCICVCVNLNLCDWMYLSIQTTTAVLWADYIKSRKLCFHSFKD